MYSNIPTYQCVYIRVWCGSIVPKCMCKLAVTISMALTYSVNLFYKTCARILPSTRSYYCYTKTASSGTSIELFFSLYV